MQVLFEQFENPLRLLIGLGQHGSGCLLNDRRACQQSALFRVVSIRYSTARRAGILHRIAQIISLIFKPVEGCAKRCPVGANAVE